MLRQSIARYPHSGLSTQQWNDFLLIYRGDVDKALNEYTDWADKEIEKITGTVPPESDPHQPLIAPDADLSTIKLTTLKAEMGRLEKLISADTVIRNQYSALTKKIATEKANLQIVKTRLEDAKGAEARRKTLQLERDASYGRLFEALVKEQNALTKLYEPLMARLTAMSGTLTKLSFRVSRTVDVAAWASAGEDLIDCRKAGEFYGRGSLEKLATSKLYPAWERGSAAEIQKAMSSFIGVYYKTLRAHAPYAPTEQEAFREWSKHFAHWIFSTEHIAVRYEILYDGTDIRKLSPGTRGIVLLLLYLALDDADDRPLIIDQPEENLDPKSVFDELVSLFIAAKTKRQVIMVTHNANLVINTDADQVIVASANTSTASELPSFSYISGGLEDAEIRKLACDILEGGERAFQERARRLRVSLAR